MDQDIDMDDYDVDPEIARLQAEADAINARADAADVEAMNGVEEMPEEGEVEASDPSSSKVHVRGVDSLNTYQIEEWRAEHYPSDLFRKVQWIDDTSANLVFDTEAAAAEALNALSAEQVGEPLQLRVAKRLSTQPEVELQIRLAIVADVKAPRAKDRSKFYLFNKEWDPDNPDNIRPDNRKRRWQDDDRRDRKYRRRDYSGRNEEKEDSHFHESMYDDDPKPEREMRRPARQSRMDSYSSGSEHGRRRGRSNEDLLRNNRAPGRLRDRSASPARDSEGDGRYGFDAVDPPRRSAKARSPIRSGRDNSGARENLRKELFPDKRSSTALANNHSNGIAAVPPLHRGSPAPSSRELFPDRLNGTSHRRQSAKDLTPTEVADAIGKCRIYNSATGPFTYSATGRRPENSSRGDRDLFSRITGGPQVESSFGRLQSEPVAAASDEGFSIKGAGGQGYSILGASRNKPENPLVKELFPLKAGGNARGEKDLFDGRIKGRAAAQRRRAEDLF